MENTIANQTELTDRDILAKLDTVNGSVRRLFEAKPSVGFAHHQMVIDDPEARKNLALYWDFLLKEKTKDGSVQTASYLCFDQLLERLQKNKLNSKLPGGLEGQVAEQIQFYRRFYGSGFALNRNKIYVSADRLLAIEKGLEINAVNTAELVVVPCCLSESEKQQTEAQLLFNKLLKPLKKDGFKIWAEAGTDRWTGLTLEEVLAGYITIAPEDFDSDALKKDWIRELSRVIGEKKSAPRVSSGKIELVFTDNRQDIPKDQKLVNQKGEIIENKYSFIEIIRSEVRVLTPAQWIVLAAQKYCIDKSYLSPNTWDWMMAILKNKDGVNTPCSVAYAHSHDSDLYLYSSSADHSDSYSRWRLAL